MAKKRDRQAAEEKAAADKAAKKAQKPPGKRTWKMMDRAAGVVGGMLATRATAVVWRGLSGKKPPKSGRHPDVNTREAVLWAMVGGGLAELVRTGVRRGTANYWLKSTGEYPPGMKPLITIPPELEEAAKAEAQSENAQPKREKKARKKAKQST